MATIRLVPSTYAVSSTNYLSVSNAANMYHNTDNTTYATVTNTYASTSSRYLYLRGFNFNDIPSGAVISSFTVKIKGYESGLSTSTSYAPRLANGTSAIANTTASANFGTSTKTITIPTGALTWQQIANYDDDFTIMVYVRRASRNTTGYFYCYGAEIEVDYTIPDPRTVATTLSGNGTIDPSGAQTYYDGDEYTLTITPTTKSDTVTVTNNGTDVTSELIGHYSGGTSTSTSAVAGSNVTTGFYRSGGAFYQSSSTSSDAWLRYAIGHSAESPYSTSNTSNTYVKDGTNDANTMGWMNYPFDFSGLPNDAEVTAVEVKCYGATESTSESARHADVELYCGSELKSTRQSFTSTSNQTITINNPGTWTREELQNAQLRFIVGYYGGRILGITWKVTYTHGGTLSYYTYSYTVSGNATIAVTIGGGGGGGPKLYFKQNSSETLIASETNTFNDDTLQYQTPANLLNIGDVIKIIFIDVSATYQRTPVKHIDYDEFTTTLTSDTYQDLGTNDIKCRVNHTYSASVQSRYYRFYPYYLYNGSSCSSMGTMNIYKITSTGSWTLVSKAYKKINGSWVQQSDLTNVFDSTKNWVKG